MPPPPPTLRVAKAASDSLALTNCLIASRQDFAAAVKYILLNQTFVFTLLLDDSCAQGECGTTANHRKWAGLSLAETVSVQPFDPATDGNFCYLSELKLEVGFFRKGAQNDDEFDAADMSKAFMTMFGGQVFTRNQPLAFDVHGTLLTVLVKDVAVVDTPLKASSNTVPKQADPTAANSHRGVLLPQTAINFVKAPDSSIRIKGSRSAGSAIVQPNFKFEDMGIGGLDSEFSSIFRRAFASRIFPPEVVKKLGIQHVKGILLFGPPGTGKTLIARQIGQMLNAKEPKIVNGPEILNKFVGASEENIRKLFKDAEVEYKARGDDSELHIIIFDEIDAICKQRGSKNDGTGVGDSIVNQLLSKLDGVEQLNNILVIGMTNRLDMIDEALIRPGRLEVHMEIGLPDEKGRLQIFKIHTATMSKSNSMESDVDLPELANLSKNYSGAEIAGVVKSAASFAFNRHIKVGTIASADANLDDLKVSRSDFMHALDEVKPSFGVSETEMKGCVINGIIHFSPGINRILADGQLFIEQVRKSPRTPLVSILLHGPAGCGKTALAATIAMASEFPFVKLISSETMVGFSESAKMTAITKVFNDSYKSPFSVIVIDSILRLLDWVPIGPRFSNGVLQTLMVLMKKNPPNDRKLLVISTTTHRGILESMDMAEAFNADIKVPTISDLAQVDKAILELKLFSESERQQAFQLLRESGIDGKFSIGIKKLLMIVEMARQDVDKVEKFVNTIQDEAMRTMVNSNNRQQ